MSVPTIPYSRTAAGLSSRNNSTSSASSNDSMGERRSSSVFKAVGQRLSQHHHGVQAAYESYYGVPKASTTSTPRRSQDSQHALVNDQYYEVDGQPAAEQSKSSKAWQKVKTAAKEHHQGVNAAYRAYYGIS